MKIVIFGTPLGVGPSNNEFDPNIGLVATRGLHLMKGGIAQQYPNILLPCPHIGGI